MFDWVEAPMSTVGKHRFSIDGLGGSGSLVYVRGRYHRGVEAEANFFLMVMRKHNEGQWRITIEMWGDLPVIGM